MSVIDESSSLKTTFSSTYQILTTNLTTFTTITTLTILPLSLLTLGSTLATHPIQTQISSKQSLARMSHTIVEAGNVWQEVRMDALALVRLKALFFFPSYAFSLIAALTAVSSTALSLSGKRPTWLTAITSATSSTWKRLLLTSFLSSVLTCAYQNLARVVLSHLLSTRVGVWVAVLEAVWEMHLMCVLSVGMVVSVLEERFGLEALRVGWGLMEGRRFCGVVLSGLVVLGSGGIGWGFKVLMDGRMGGGILMGFVGNGVLVGLFCWVVLVSYVANTVLYFEGRKYHGIEMGNSSHRDNMDVELGEEDSVL
ncbi:hypothetical protein MRB53_013413 [Persea americana]|uniref:Uncharacterized protein n=1 Tax=Persea americana TaxID=3435 RepID=A0ACC2K8C0_PERAE|nr:hypothetical protein MRB53_013413 [Persea americana]